MSLNPYEIVQAKLFFELAQQVNQKMQEGYEPIGGVATDQNYFYQALIIPIRYRIDFSQGKRKLNMMS